MTREPSLRLFTGIAIDEAIVRKIDDALDPIRPLARLNWSPPGNFHITVQFIGAWPEPKLDELTAALRTIEPLAPFDISIRGLAFFPNPRRPRFFFAGIHAAPELAELHRRNEQALEPLGIQPEDRAWSPHLTLARVKTENIGELQKRVQPLSDADFGSFTAAEFHLFRSVTSPTGSVYSRVASFPLGLKS